MDVGSDPEDGREDRGVVPALPGAGRRRGQGTASSLLMAAMLGLVEALGWEKPKDETVEVADAPHGNGDLELDYRHLDPLD